MVEEYCCGLTLSFHIRSNLRSLHMCVTDQKPLPRLMWNINILSFYKIVPWMKRYTLMMNHWNQLVLATHDIIYKVFFSWGKIYFLLMAFQTRYLDPHKETYRAQPLEISLYCPFFYHKHHTAWHTKSIFQEVKQCTTFVPFEYPRQYSVWNTPSKVYWSSQLHRYLANLVAVLVGYQC